MTDNNLDIWLTIPTGTRRQYLEDIIKESQISPEKIVIVHTVESEPIEGVNNILQALFSVSYAYLLVLLKIVI